MSPEKRKELIEMFAGFWEKGVKDSGVPDGCRHDDVMSPGEKARLMGMFAGLGADAANRRSASDVHRHDDDVMSLSKKVELMEMFAGLW